MDRLFLFSLLLTNLQATESNDKTNCLSQPAQKTEHHGESSQLECIVRDGCQKDGIHFQWFVFKDNNQNHLINLSSDPHRFSLVKGSLQIKSLNVGDSGIYHCAAVLPGEPMQGRQYVGPGTTLIVQGQNKKLKNILLWLSLVLLTMYSLAIVSLIIVKKFGCNLSICRGLDKADKNNSTKTATRRTQFRDVLEEMYSKKNLAKQKQTADKNEAEAASTDFNNSTEDIYQNV